MTRTFPACALVALLAVAPLAAPLDAQDAPNPAVAPPLEKRFDGLHLTVRLPAAWQMVESSDTTGQQVVARWRGKLGGSALVVGLRLFPHKEFPADEPTGLIDMITRSRSGPGPGGSQGL